MGARKHVVSPMGRGPMATAITFISEIPEAEGGKGGRLPLPSDDIVRAACQGNCEALRLMLTQHGSEVLNTRDNIEGCMLARNETQLRCPTGYLDCEPGARIPPAQGHQR